ncbi:MAG: UbiA family prenyltransferase [Gammaproteobacteria bacterium]|nr:UbiA family prenyltransferase [Gammaproteobacteria bacterium]MCP5200831.1 UbiA family prenyltransferase [Gammaproteobacteria bacterium]
MSAVDPATAAPVTPPAVLRVDVDHGLVPSGLAAELVLAAVRREPWRLLAPQRLRAAVDGALPPPDPARLVYDEAVLAALRAAREAGRPLQLVSRCPRRVVEIIARHLGIEDADIVAATGAAPATLPPGWRGALWRALRPHQWIKNLLLFVPLVMAHQLGHAGAVLAAGAGFVAFSLTASAVYLLNDLLDLAHDRAHPRKRWRPLASGALPLRVGALAAPVVLALALAIALLLPGRFLAVLAVYLAANLAYTLIIKRAALADVIVLAGMYTLRVIAGAAAVDVPLSFWLLAFSMFFFFSLAMVKRHGELRRATLDPHEKLPGRGYRADDLDTLASFGITSGQLAVLVLALYINSGAVHGLYAHPKFLWALCPLVLYVVSRAWLVARRGELDDDPLVFVLGDARSLAAGALALVALWLAL